MHANVWFIINKQFKLYRGGQFYWWKPEYPEDTNDLQLVISITIQLDQWKCNVNASPFIYIKISNHQTVIGQSLLARKGKA